MSSTPVQQVMDNANPSSTNNLSLSQPLLSSGPSEPGLRPWDVGPQNIYDEGSSHDNSGSACFQVPEGFPACPDEATFVELRRKILREWGQKREYMMHRSPRWLMDQLVSGSGLYPIRLLDDSWLTDREKSMVRQLEVLLQNTCHGRSLAYDMITPLIYDIELVIVLDDSGSMSLDMFGGETGPYSGFDIEATSAQDDGKLSRALQASLPGGWFSDPSQANSSPALGGLNPHHSRWYFARHHLRTWMQVFSIMGLDPWLYRLNGDRCRCSDMESVFLHGPLGSTPTAAKLRDVLRDLAPKQSGFWSSGRQQDKKPLLIVGLTDGEANEMDAFNAVLDQIQNDWYGDVQVCLMGLSLRKEDIEWFENEECDETRIRTVEAFEVEHRQIQLREVTKKEGGYNFHMHVMRVLVTNFYPSDYDYEAPKQNFRHRLFITTLGQFRRVGLSIPGWDLCCSQLLCSACFLGTCCHGCGWLQGNECGKIQKPEGVELVVVSGCWAFWFCHSGHS
eukprot:TRINITY_DN6571_c1_g3_i1.p1 TRINITY_DN6571_c1_g3~~TRINITY_DN6571_c1_g3_i1.p1  ORF type:complete len:506 (-),score=66.04 TRINITY_DN6571_c1_g3_i1:220-1737(-)